MLSRWNHNNVAERSGQRQVYRRNNWGSDERAWQNQIGQSRRRTSTGHDAGPAQPATARLYRERNCNCRKLVGYQRWSCGAGLMSRSAAQDRGIEILATIRSWGTCGVDPAVMGMGPVPAVNVALKRANWNVAHIDLIEANEAFAVQSLAVIRELHLQRGRVNVNGGAIALGRRIGASGARILVTLLHELRRNGLRRGLATLCIGGGMGIALCVERA